MADPRVDGPPPTPEDASDADAPTIDHPVLLFDGVCRFCSGFVRFVIERDPDAVLRFAPLQSEVAQALLADAAVDPQALDSIVLVDDGEVHVKSDAVIRTGEHLGGSMTLLQAFKVVPRALRDVFYDAFAAVRYRLFGTYDSCMVPTPDVRARFLD